MKEKIKIPPNGLKRVECITNDYNELKRIKGQEFADDMRKYYNLDRLTIGKVYPCRVDKTGKVLILKIDKGEVQRVSYKYFKPVEIIKIKSISLKKRIANRLIKILKKV